MAKNNIIIIPARSGSKSIPDKNLMKVGGVSLIRRACLVALTIRNSQVFVSTDSERISEEVRDLSIKVIDRDPLLGLDITTTEEVISEVLRKIDHRNFHNIILIQPTSPFIKSAELAQAIEVYNLNNNSVVFSATDHHCFKWVESGNSYAPMGFDLGNRLPRQLLAKTLVETGGFWIMDKENFLMTRTRYCGTPVPFLVSKIFAHEIDNYEDLFLAQDIAYRIDLLLDHLINLR